MNDASPPGEAPGTGRVIVIGEGAPRRQRAASFLQHPGVVALQGLLVEAHTSSSPRTDTAGLEVGRVLVATMVRIDAIHLRPGPAIHMGPTLARPRVDTGPRNLTFAREPGFHPGMRNGESLAVL